MSHWTRADRLMGPTSTVQQEMAADTGIIWKTEQWGEAPGTEGETEQTWAHRGADRAHRDPLCPPSQGMPHSPGCGHLRLPGTQPTRAPSVLGKQEGSRSQSSWHRPQCPAAFGRVFCLHLPRGIYRVDHLPGCAMTYPKRQTWTKPCVTPPMIPILKPHPQCNNIRGGAFGKRSAGW